jgi:translocation and assembly module TamA
VAFDYYGGELKSGVLVRATRELSIFPSLNLDTYVVNAPANVRDHVPPAVLGCVVGEPCVVTFLDVSTEFDRRDNKLAPKEGYFLALDVQGGVSQTVSLKPFFKLTTEARGYVSFGGAHRVFTLAGKVRAGTLISTDDDTPIVVRFFSGGSSMRGFNQRRLSPQVAVPTPTTQAPLGDVNQGETFPIGGNGLLEGSLELRWNVWGELTLAIFNDWGLVTAQALGAATDLGRSLYAAVGIGARYRTPIGPIRLDFGVRLPFVGGPLDAQKQGVSTFSSSTGCFFWPAATQRAAAPAYGGSPEGLCAVHLSIGEAF